MVDSGATHNFIDRKFAAMHSIPMCLMAQPRELKLADGRPSTGGLITHRLFLPLRLNAHTEVTELFVTSMNTHSMILGLPWLVQHNPKIHWPLHTLTFSSNYCLTHCSLKQPCTVSSTAVKDLQRHKIHTEISSASTTVIVSAPLSPTAKETSTVTVTTPTSAPKEAPTVTARLS
jgi:hypothetical protein